MKFLDVWMYERSSQKVLWMLDSDWYPLKSEGLMSCVCLGFEIPHVEYLMAVQVVGLMVLQRLELVLTWVGA